MLPFPPWLGMAGIGFIAGALAVSVLVYPIAHSKGVDDGRKIERTAALERSMETIRERGETNAEINRMGDAELCIALGGKWVQPDCL